ncbi:MAG: DUF1990 domain-containing protein [Pirellulales bacterium]
MWFLKKPSDEEIQAFLARQSRQTFSYAEVGASRSGSPTGFDLDHNRVQLGEGRAVYEAACLALSQWAMFPGSWTEICPQGVPVEEGNDVAVLFRVMGLWWVTACRIVYVVDETAPTRRFGFAYGTLPAHIECGEERFSIEWQADDTVWYDIRAFSRPRYWLTRLGYPIARRFQRRFVRESQAAMCEAVARSALGTAVDGIV